MALDVAEDLLGGSLDNASSKFRMFLCVSPLYLVTRHISHSFLSSTPSLQVCMSLSRSQSTHRPTQLADRIARLRGKVPELIAEAERACFMAVINVAVDGTSVVPTLHKLATQLEKVLAQMSAPDPSWLNELKSETLKEVGAPCGEKLNEKKEGSKKGSTAQNAGSRDERQGRTTDGDNKPQGESPHALGKRRRDLSETPEGGESSEARAYKRRAASHNSIVISETSNSIRADEGDDDKEVSPLTEVEELTNFDTLTAGQ